MAEQAGNCNNLERRPRLICALVFRARTEVYECYILKAIKNATGTIVIFPINISLVHFVFVLTSVPNVGERYSRI